MLSHICYWSSCRPFLPKPQYLSHPVYHGVGWNFKKSGPAHFSTKCHVSRQVGDPYAQTIKQEIWFKFEISSMPFYSEDQPTECVDQVRQSVLLPILARKTPAGSITSDIVFFVQTFWNSNLSLVSMAPNFSFLFLNVLIGHRIPIQPRYSFLVYVKHIFLNFIFIL